VFVGAFAYIGNDAEIGNHVKIHPPGLYGDNVVIGDHSVIYPG
jgi:UDP-3-O-[3-hydroxymyristoyl] glucosamine N-acyltransferase